MDEIPAPSHPTALDSWPAQVAVAVATGVVTARWPMERWTRTARWTLHSGLGVLAGAAAGLAARRPDLLTPEDSTREEPRAPLRPVATAEVVVGLGALVTGLSRGSEAADSWAERTLAARGVRRPRVWMGVAAAGLSLAMSVAERRDKDASRAEEPHPTGA
jgi:hypothetical protein